MIMTPTPESDEDEMVSHSSRTGTGTVLPDRYSPSLVSGQVDMSIIVDVWSCGLGVQGHIIPTRSCEGEEGAEIS